MFVLLFVFVFRVSTCHNVLDVEYSEKIVSDRKDDWFGRSLAKSYHKLVIGAPKDDNRRGSVMMADESVRVKGPAGGEDFGDHVDVNQQFMVVSGKRPFSVYVFSPYSPYDMVANIPIDGGVHSLVISDDNTIAVSYKDYILHNWLTIYEYDFFFLFFKQ